MEEEVKNARAKLAERFANNNTQIGGKGRWIRSLNIHSVQEPREESRRSTSTPQVWMKTKNWLLQSRNSVRGMILFSWSHVYHNFNLGVQPLQDIDEVNMFKDDNTVIHFKRP